MKGKDETSSDAGVRRSMIDQFNMPNIALLQKLGYQVDVACNFIEGNTCSEARVAELKQKLQDMHVRCYQIDFARNIKHMGQNMRALRQVESLMKQNGYAFVTVTARSVVWSQGLPDTGQRQK